MFKLSFAPKLNQNLPFIGHPLHPRPEIKNLLAYHVDARGGSQGGCYRRKDGDGEVQDFL
jgi:hypothetical protein